MTPSRTPNQRGVTMIEVLLVIAITGLIAAPVGAWAVATMRHQEQTANILRTAVGSGRLASSFSRDVGVASKVITQNPAGDCTGGGKGIGQVKLALESSTTGARIVYSEAPSDDSPSYVSIWRRACDAGGALAQATELLPRVVPGSVEAACLGAGEGSADCEDESSLRVRLRFRACPTNTARAAGPCDAVNGHTELAEVHARRRVTPGYTEYSGQGPIAQIQVSPRVGYLDTDFTLDASASRGVGDPGATVAWSFPTASGGTTSNAVQVTKRFASAGEHEVQLTITDADGRTNTAATRIRIIHRFPQAVASYDPATRTFSAAGTTNPDGLSLVYTWNFGEGMEAIGQVVPSPWGPDATGRRRAVLYVYDQNNPNIADTDSVTIDLGAPPSGPITITPTPVEVAGKPPTVGSVGPGRDPLEVSFSSEDGDPTSNWRITRRGTTEVIATGTGAQFTHTFGPLGHGEYEVARLDAAGGVRGEPVVFRVNAAPVAGFLVNAGGVGGATTFVGDGAGGSGDPDGTVLSYRWELGWPGWTATGPSPSFVYPNPGTYVVKLTVEDEDGAETSTERLVRIAGSPAAPPPPQWVGDQVRWDGVPGAEMYRVTVQCTVGAPFVDDVGSAARSVNVPAGFCAAGAVTATLQVRADDKWSAPSPGVNR